MKQQIIPKKATQKYQDVFTRLLFECGNLSIGIRTFDNVCIIPRCQLSGSKIIKINDFLNGAHEPCDLMPDGGGIGVRCHSWPETLVTQK